MRARFFIGKASFVEADVRMTTNNMAEGGASASGQAKLLAHYHLKTRTPRAGAQGWRLYAERLGGPRPRRVVALECGYCRHHFVIEVLASLDPLASDLTGGKGPGDPASYTADWFRFMHENFEGAASLFCLRCEQHGRPRVHFEEASR